MNRNAFNVTIDKSVSCNEMSILGAVSCVFFVIRLPANLTLICTILKNKTLRTPVNCLITSLAVCNICGIVVQLPLFSANAFSCKFIFSHSVCILMAFSLLFSSNMNNYILAMICIERYLVICKPSAKSQYLKKSRIIFALFISLVVGAFWSLTPLFGWSEYYYEGIGLSCAVNSGFKNFNLLTHAVAIIICCYILPIIVFTYTSKQILQTVNKSSKQFSNRSQDGKKLKKESHLVKVTLTLIAAFFVSYTPVVVGVLFSLVKGTDVTSINPVILTCSILIARSSLIWPALLYMFMNKDIKRHLFRYSNVSRVTPGTTRIFTNQNL